MNSINMVLSNVALQNQKNLGMLMILTSTVILFFWLMFALPFLSVVAGISSAGRILEINNELIFVFYGNWSLTANQYNLYYIFTIISVIIPKLALSMIYWGFITRATVSGVRKKYGICDLKY